MDVLANAWKHLKLTDEEDAAIQIESTSEAWAGSSLQLCLAGKLLTNKKFNGAAMKTTLASAWNLEKEATVREISDNLFVFQFLSMEDKQSVIDRGPWCFDDQMLLTSDINEKINPSQMQFQHTLFWVHLLEVPLGYRNEETIKALGDKLGGYVTHDKEDPLLLGETIRVRVKFNISKPLYRRLAMQYGDSKIWIGVKYERLPSFCYCCGRLGHQGKECTDSRAKELSSLHMQYGVWLHAPKMKRRLRPTKVEIERESIWLKTQREKGINDTTVVAEKNEGAGLKKDCYGNKGSGAMSPSDIIMSEENKNNNMLEAHQEAQTTEANQPKSVSSCSGPPIVDLKLPAKPKIKKKNEVGQTSDAEMSGPKFVGSKRKAHEEEALLSLPLEGSGPEKKAKDNSGSEQSQSQVANMEEVHVREEQ